MKPDALIFDMDGTLWDAVDTYAEGFNDYFRQQQLARTFTRTDLLRYMGVEQAPFLAAMFPEVEPTERNRIYEQIIAYQYERVQADGGHLYPGVKAGLQALQAQYQLFIVSNCHEHMIDYFTRWAGIAPYFTATMAHGVNFQPKHENIRHLIRTYQLQNPVYVGDTASDAEQSRLVPLPFVFVDYGFGEVADYPLRFSSFSGLVNYYLSF